jgi:beta-mannosidase
VKTLLAGKDSKGVVLLAEVLVGGKVVSSNEHFFGAYKDLSLPKPQIDADVLAVRGGFKITLSADKLARAVYLSAPNYPGVFADNYFDLIPGRTVEVEFRAAKPIALNDFRKQLKIRSMADAF